MIPDDIQALALADAIGALDPDERVDLEARLAGLPPTVRAEVAHLYDASVEIAASAHGEGRLQAFGTPCSPGLPRRPTTRSPPPTGNGSRPRCPACG